MKKLQKKGLLYDKKRKTRAGYLSKTYKDVIICLSVLPRLQFSIHLITQTLLGPVAVTVAWLYIKPFGEGPTGDPVDSDPDNKHPNWWKGVTNPDCLLSEPTVWSHKDFAIRMKLWPFSPILPVLKKYIFEPTFGKDVESQKEWQKFTCFTLHWKKK